MSDTESIRSSVRASTFLNRPQIAPMGPRTRQSSLRVSSFLENGVSSPPASATSPGGSAWPGSPSMTMSPTTLTPTPLSPVSSPNLSTPTSSARNISRLIIPPPIIHEPPKPLNGLEEFGGQNHEPPERLEPSTSALSAVAEVEELSPSPASAPAYELDTPLAPSHEPPTPLAPQSRPTLVLDTGGSISDVQSSTSPASEHISHLAVSEDSASPVSAPAYEHGSSAASIASIATSDLQDDAPAKITPIPQPPAKLVPPPAVKFGTSQVQWKGLPLEAALWTMDSKELQDIVSRAIRNSAKESFIRILTLDNLDHVLPAELERLETQRATTQAKYRFLVHRRAMLFQAISSTNLGQQKDGEDGVSVVNRLASQLAETIAECDQRLEEVLKINDHIAQINKLIDVHWASALAIALRKLNGSYARRTKDLVGARGRITQLEAELEDAWKEAEKMAKELDDYEDAIVADDTVAIIETAEIVPVPSMTPSDSPPRNRRSSVPMPMTPTLMAVKSIIGSHATPAAAMSPISPMSATAASFVFPPPSARQSQVQVQLKEKENEAEDVPDTVSIRSGRSTRSAKSSRSHRSVSRAGVEQTHTSSVQAAKRRSHRASQGSLRLGHMKKHSGATKLPFEDDSPPPMPELPVQYLNSTSASNTQLFGPPGSPHGTATLLQHLESHPYVGPSLRRQASLDTLATNGIRSPAVLDATRGRALDDLYVRPNQGQSPSSAQYSPVFRPPNHPRAATDTNAYLLYGLNKNPVLEDEIQLVPRTPPYTSQTFSIYDYRQMNPLAAEVVPPRPPPKDPPKTNGNKMTIPSMWMNADAESKAQPVHHDTLQIDNTIDSTSATSASASAARPPSPSVSVSSASGISTQAASSSFQPYNMMNGTGQHPLYGQFATQAAYVPPAVSSFPERAESTSLGRRATTTRTYDKLKGLTKRYSVSLPMFNNKGLGSIKGTSSRSG